jgi:alkanesulfonate monooxygenase SsuD/methylene tetrahydromethanopterin reductase-like flavin-dependent oxidoreductase (luciferase family)
LDTHFGPRPRVGVIVVKTPEHDRIGRERGWGPTNRGRFEAEADEGSLYVGSPETVAVKIANTVRALGVDRFEFKYSSGTLDHEKLMTTVRLYGEEVVPRVKQLLAQATAGEKIAS